MSKFTTLLLSESISHHSQSHIIYEFENLKEQEQKWK